MASAGEAPREQFEQAATEMFGGNMERGPYGNLLDRDSHFHDEYKFADVHAAWRMFQFGWRARGDASPSPEVGKVVMPNDGFDRNKPNSSTQHGAITGDHGAVETSDASPSVPIGNLWPVGTCGIHPGLLHTESPSCVRWKEFGTESAALPAEPSKEK